MRAAEIRLYLQGGPAGGHSLKAEEMPPRIWVVSRNGRWELADENAPMAVAYDRYAVDRAGLAGSGFYRLAA